MSLFTVEPAALGDNGAMETKRKRRFQFRLRTLLVFTAIAAVDCDWSGGRIERNCKDREEANSIVSKEA